MFFQSFQMLYLTQMILSLEKLTKTKIKIILTLMEFHLRELTISKQTLTA
jgi:hypothetical protein